MLKVIFNKLDEIFNNMMANKLPKIIIISICVVLLVIVLVLGGYLGNRFYCKKRLETIDNLFGEESFISADQNETSDGYNLTYGELTWRGMNKITEYMKLNGYPKKTFIDLGSGNGRTLAYAILGGFEEAKGTELFKKRHEYATNMREKLDKSMRDKIKLTNADLFTLDPSYFSAGSVIFISNLLYSEALTQKLIDFLSDHTPSDVVIVLSTCPENLQKFRLKQQINTPMSWAADSICHVLSKM